MRRATTLILITASLLTGALATAASADHDPVRQAECEVHETVTGRPCMPETDH